MKITSQKKFPEYKYRLHALIYFIPMLGIYYIRNHKCGSTSTLDFIRKNLYTPLSNYMNFRMKDGIQGYHYYRNNVIHYPFHVNQKKIFCFTFVKNPYQRILSAYLDIILQRNAYRIKFSLKKNHNDYALWKNIDIDNLSFKDYIHIVSKHNPHKMDVHWMPQSIYLNFKAINYSFIGRMENYEEDIIKLFSTILKDKKKTKPPHNLNTKSREKLHDYYTPDLVDKVYKIYKDDFEILGYSKDIDQIDQYDDSKLPQLPLKKTIPIPNRLRVKLIRQRINILKSTLKDTTKELIHS